MQKNSPSSLYYRPGVGIALFNRQGLVLIAERIDRPDAWQLPQGGIDEGENPEIAVFREMEEEIGTRSAEIIGVMDEWLSYDFPPLGKNSTSPETLAWRDKYRGQRQKWFALKFLGGDKDIRLNVPHAKPEFKQWKWIPLPELPGYAVFFKRDIYERVTKEFAKHAAGSPPSRG